MPSEYTLVEAGDVVVVKAVTDAGESEGPQADTTFSSIREAVAELTRNEPDAVVWSGQRRLT